MQFHLGYDWLYLSDGYLQFVYKSPTEIQRWFEFFERLGVVDGLVVEKQTLKFDAQQLVSDDYMLSPLTEMRHMH